MPNPTAISKYAPVDAAKYRQLINSIKAEIQKGQKEIELAKATAYWHIGEHIAENLLANRSRAGYGEGLYGRLSADLKINARTLQQMVQFYRELPIPSARSQFSWTHYRELLTVGDINKRQALINRLKNKKITTRVLQTQIKTLKTKNKGHKPLTYRKGDVYTYQLSQPAVAPQQSGYLVVDCGFEVWRQIPASAELAAAKPGTIVESTQTESWFQLKATQRSEESLFTYRAYPERVIDGDTVIFQIDLGLRTWVRQTLRLRGIDTPEAGTPKGRQASEFLKETFKSASPVIITTYRPDKYRRYLADIFIGPKEKYLNQILLDRGLASLYND